MISVEKEAKVPLDLIAQQEAIKAQLIAKKQQFRWRQEHYSDPIKAQLKALYHNKCGFCERKLTDKNSDRKFTVEHYRPKSYYWWLGNEWTNLFPTCERCNDNKRDDFPLFSERNRIQHPPIVDDQIDCTQCKASAAPLSNEQPLFVHPEVDQPESLFIFLPNGKMAIHPDSDTKEQQRARVMLAKFFNDGIIEEERLKHIEALRQDLELAISNFIKVIGQGDYNAQHVQLAFFSFFEKLFNGVKSEQEFSRLNYFMTRPTLFEDFFLADDKFPYGPEVKKLVLQALHLYVQQ